jgi:hypothetical protein
VRAQLKRKISTIILAAVAFVLFFPAFETASRAVATDAPLAAALCQVVYPLDQFPTAKNYHYTFFGNAFFINEEGYLITAGHVLSAFREGGQPHIIVGSPNEPRQLLEAPLIAADWEHDVAILRATPNPFLGVSKIAYLPLSVEIPPRGKSVLAASVLSSEVENASSLDAPLEGLSQGEVLGYQFHQEVGAPDSEVLLVSQQVAPGQSGSPLVSADSHGVVGIIVGRWLFPVVMPSAVNGSHVALSPGAALRIHYAISLLQKNHIAWHAAAETSSRGEAAAQEAGFAPPVPVSVVGTNYPPQALFGGDVLLDALIDSSGKPTDIRVVSGDGPFLEPALSAVRTWTFTPARLDGRAVEARIGIVFQFPQSFVPRLAAKERKHNESVADSDDRGALPVVTVEPDYPTNSVAQGSVGLYNLVDSEGHITSTSTLLDVGSLTAPTAAALRQWQFAPAKHAGAATESAVVVVETFRRPTL